MTLTTWIQVARSQSAHSPSQIRIATYNASLYGKQAGEIHERLRDGTDVHAINVARVVQTVRPDVLLINEIDYDDDGRTASVLNEQYFGRSQADLQAIEYPHVYAVPSNTGVDSRLDLNQNTVVGEPNDAWGFGVYPGQYSMAIYSRFPIDADGIRTFQKFLWKDLPGAMRPVDPTTNQPYHSDAIWDRLRLSSKNHVDVPIRIGTFTLHVLASHPTPPVFDGPEDRNGCRNHDEIQFWSEYLQGESATALVDDQGRAGGLNAGQSFVIMGDLNADSFDGDGKRGAINRLIAHPRVQDPEPKSEGAVEASRGQNASAKQKGDPALDTANFGGNMRVDYVLPCRTLTVKQSGVVWPRRDAKNFDMISTSDHRMVWVDVMLPESGDAAHD
ncbi:MAG: endonuclease/exonuclease/phosphatase family protein [Pirellulaceae bacterium]|nr:endonuclease/exonuclease/phosphatase family protein [Pirellulaceae bacterium]